MGRGAVTASMRRDGTERYSRGSAYTRVLPTLEPVAATALWRYTLRPEALDSFTMETIIILVEPTSFLTS